MFPYDMFIAFTHAFYMFAYSIMSIIFEFIWVFMMFAYEIFVAFTGHSRCLPRIYSLHLQGHTSCLPTVS